MASSESICALVEVEQSLSRLEAFCEVVHDANPGDAPAWLTVVWHLVRDAQRHADGLRLTEGRSC
jgi:hypothetical protein